MFLELLLRWFPQRPKSKFKIGDSVRLKTDGARQMRVLEISASTEKNDPIIVCRYEDARTGEIVTNLYRESNLEPSTSRSGRD